MKQELTENISQHIIISKDRETIFSNQYQSHFLHLFLLSGQISLHVGEWEHHISGGDGIILIEGKPIEVTSYSDDAEIVAILISTTYLHQYEPKITFNIKGLPFYYQNPIMHMNAEQMQLCIDGLEHIRFRMNQSDHLYWFETLQRTIDIFIYDLFSIYTLCNSEQSTKGGQEAIITQKFIDLVKEHVKSERTVAFYAEQLFVTPKYLSKVCVHATGQNASFWISQFALSQMLEEITQTDHSLTDISDGFHFSNLSHFTRFIKLRTGSTPSEFRLKRNSILPEAAS